MTPPAAAAAPAVRRARSTAPSRPRPAARPRRVSGPARPARPRQPTTPAPRLRDAGFAFGLLAALDRIQRHRLLDRLIAGRIWIALVAFALIGIVTLQLLLLTLNGDIGRSLEREGVLQRENAALSIEDSELAAGERVEARATRLGMQLVAPGSLRFLSAARGGEVTRAAGALSAPVQPTSSAASEANASTAASGEASSETEATPTTEPTPAAGEATATAPATEAASDETAASTSGAQTPSAETSVPGGEAGSPAATQQSSATSASAGGGTQASPAG
jgi:cell division protein FtsL